MLNHVSSPQRVAAFAAAARPAGVTVPARRRRGRVHRRAVGPRAAELPGLHLGRRRSRPSCAAPDPLGAGIDAALAEARALLAIPGVVGVNLSGLASARGVEAAAEVKAEIGRRLRADIG